MKKNMGTLDKILRVLIALAIVILYVTGIISGTIGIILGAVAIIFFVTSAFGVCPLYSVCKISTQKKSSTN